MAYPEGFVFKDDRLQLPHLFSDVTRLKTLIMVSTTPFVSARQASLSQHSLLLLLQGYHTTCAATLPFLRQMR